MKQRSLRFIVPNWVKWSLAIGFICLIAVVIYGIYFYQTVEMNRRTEFNLSNERVLEETNMTTVLDISRYHGAEYFHVIRGENSDGEPLLAYINQGAAEDIKLFSLNDFVSKQEIINNWRDNCDDCQLLHAEYAIREDIPLVEITYIDEANRLSYRNYRLDDGTYESGVSFSTE